MIIIRISILLCWKLNGAAGLSEHKYERKLSKSVGACQAWYKQVIYIKDFLD
jgi:hypothetical protein